MAEPINFTSTTPRFNLPVLFPGQAQREFFVNQAHAILDAIIQPVIEGMATAAPSSPAEGEAWIVLTPAEGNWAGHEDAIATFTAGEWLFTPPAQGMQAFARDASRRIFYMNGWNEAGEPSSPSGGSIVDTEARTAIEQIIGALRQIGVFSPA